MSFKFFISLESNAHYKCVRCSTDLAFESDLLSEAFRGRTGTAWLFERVFNVYLGYMEDRVMTTGLHTIAEIYCKGCNINLGWKYEQAFQFSQRYKQDKYILEKELIYHCTETSNTNMTDQHISTTMMDTLIIIPYSNNCNIKLSNYNNEFQNGSSNNNFQRISLLEEKNNNTTCTENHQQYNFYNNYDDLDIQLSNFLTLTTDNSVYYWDMLYQPGLQTHYYYLKYQDLKIQDHLSGNDTMYVYSNFFNKLPEQTVERYPYCLITRRDSSITNNNNNNNTCSGILFHLLAASSSNKTILQTSTTPSSSNIDKDQKTLLENFHLKKKETITLKLKIV